MNYLRESDTLILSIPPAIFVVIGGGCRYIEFSENPLWREIGWAGARIFPYVATLAGAPLVIHRFACSLILRITNLATRKQLKEIVDLTDFMDKRLILVSTALALIPIAVIYGPWIFKSSESIDQFVEKAKTFYIETASRFDNLPA